MIGADARCTDGPCGQVSQVVIGPATLTVTHLVVEPEHPRQMGRLVPLALVSTAPGGIGIAAQVRGDTRIVRRMRGGAEAGRGTLA